jgi:hypothetical protein
VYVVQSRESQGTERAGRAAEGEVPFLVALLGVFLGVLGDGDEFGDCDAVEVAESLGDRLV